MRRYLTTSGIERQFNASELFWMVQATVCPRHTYKKCLGENYILYLEEPTCFGIFPVYMGMTLTFTDFQEEVGLNHVHYWKSVNIRSIPE